MDHTSEPPASGEPDRPLLAGRYRLGAVLGRGGMADVLAAEDTVLGRQVAIKLFRPDVSTAADQRGQAGEIRALADLRHRGLVTLFDAGTDAPGTVHERAFLVMELVTGPSLADRLATGPLPPAEVADLGAQLADTLAYVHSAGVVHRDVKPANVLLDEVPGRPGALTPRLTDFGVARLIDSTRLTQVGTTVGTANYLSPEQALGRDVGGASDVYALGLVLLECLTGQVAFPGAGVAAAAARLHRDPDVPAGLDERWRELLTAMTRREPADRPTAAQAADVLRGIALGTAATAVLDAAPLLPPVAGGAATAVLPSPSRRPRPWLWAVLAAVAVVIIALIVALNSGSGPGGGGAPTSGPPSTAPTTPTTATSPTVRTSTHTSTIPTTATSPTTKPAAPPGHPGHGKSKSKHKGG